MFRVLVLSIVLKLGLSYFSVVKIRPTPSIVRGATSSAYEQYIAAKRDSDRQLKEESVQRQYHEHLDRIAAGDDEAIASLGTIDSWRKFAAPGITISPSGYSTKGFETLYAAKNNILNASYLSTVSQSLDARGFAILEEDLFNWKAHDVDMEAIALTMSNLVAAGWPPVFIFLFDQPWRLCLRLFDLMAPILNDEETTLEASMHAWALEKPPIPSTDSSSSSSSTKEKVGSNFGVPHRDITFKNCHNEVDGSPDILSIWIPVVDVNSENGGMMVIPREADKQFSIDNLPKDQDPFSHRFPYASVKPLSPISAGTTLIWHPNLIHWGAACSPYSTLPPRKSIAMAFRVRDERRKSTEKEITRYGRLPFRRQELLEGGPDYKARLRMIVKSLILYNVW